MTEQETSSQLEPELLEVLNNVLDSLGLELNTHKVTRGCRPGDNYLGDVLRVTVTARSTLSDQIQEHKFIFKCPPPNKKWREGLQTIKYTRNETIFYTQILPLLESFKDKYAREKMPCISVPKYYTSQCDTDYDVLILEDISPQGYIMADRMKGLDLEHCNVVMQELGRFHAISLGMKALVPNEFEKIKTLPREVYFFEGGRPQFLSVHHPCNAALRMVQYRFPDTNYADKLKELTSNFFDNMMELVSTETDLSVISHGDYWTNNILFKYFPDGSPEKIVLLDFQAVHYTSLALDLSFFIYICTTQETRDKHWEEIVTVYLAEVNDALAKFGTASSQVSRARLDAELVRFGRYGVGMSLMSIPLFTTPTHQQPSLDGGIEVLDQFHQNTYTNKICCQHITDAVEDAIKRGFFNSTPSSLLNNNC